MNLTKLRIALMSTDLQEERTRNQIKINKIKSDFIKFIKSFKLDIFNYNF